MANLDRRRFVLVDSTRKRYLDLASLWEVSIWQARQLSAQQREPLFDGLAVGRTLRALRMATAAIEPRADERLQEWARRWAATQGIPADRETFVRVLLEPRFARDCRSLIAWRLAAQRHDGPAASVAIERQNPGFLRRFGLRPPREVVALPRPEMIAPERGPRTSRPAPLRVAPALVEHH